MENHQSSAAPPNGQGGSGSPENKDDAVPNLSAAAEVAATVATSIDDVSKGKSVAANDDKELKPHIVAERNRRNRMKDYFVELQALVPEIPEKSDKATIVGHVVDYIRSLEKTMATLEKRKQEQAAASSVASSSAAPPPPQTAQGMALAAMSSDVRDACSAAPPLPQPLASVVPVPAISSDVPQPLQQPLVAAAQPQPPSPLPPPPQRRSITARQEGFQTWTWPNLVLSVSNGTVYISVSAPRHRGMWTMVMVVSVLNKYGIDVVTAQIDADDVRSVFNIYARATAMNVENPLAPLEVYQLAVSEILVWLATN